MKNKITKFLIYVLILMLSCGASFYYGTTYSTKEKIIEKVIEKKCEPEKKIKKDTKDENQIKEEPKKESQKEDNVIVEKNNFVSYNGWLKIKNNTLVNQYNEKIQLKGISTHGLQWYGNLATKDNLKILKEDWGANLFRIAMYTEENGYIQNKDIKKDVKKIVDYAKELDMYVIIDWHILSDGNPMKNIGESKKFFEEMSKEYANVPNVIFEICNEPNGDVTWKDHIKPYAEEITKIIRKNNEDAIIIVGTGTYSQDIDKAAEDPLDDQKTMYALHFYAGSHQQWLRDRAEKALKSIPIFVSEWGTSDASGNGGVFEEETSKWIQFMKEKNLSWSNWSLCDKNESSALLKEGKNIIKDENLSKSGKIVKKSIKE